MEAKIGMLVVFKAGCMADALDRFGTIMGRSEDRWGVTWAVHVPGLVADADDPEDFVARYCVDRVERVTSFDDERFALVKPGATTCRNQVRFCRVGVPGHEYGAPIGVYLAREVDEWPSMDETVPPVGQ